jgi:glycosyltransferase involved in cell wall biosynthesis
VRPERIDQVVPSFGRRDAIGVHILHLRDLLREAGFVSDIWCVGAFEEVRSECRLLDELEPGLRPATWWLYHMSNGSPAADVMKLRPEPLMLDYHNITPGELFEPWVGWAVESAHTARDQLAELAARSHWSFADSAFNDSELKELGCEHTTVVAPLFDPSAASSRPDEATLRERRAERDRGGVDWLFVGRVAPPKAQHDLIKAFCCFCRYFEPGARLTLVGPWMGEDYPRALMRFADRLGLGTSVRLTGSVSDEVLSAYYSTSDVYVSASDHEGFCIPLIEAMHHGLPVVAHAAGAVAETAGEAAMVLAGKSPIQFAATVARVLRDEGLRSRLVGEGRSRAKEFSLRRSRERWNAALKEAVSSPGRTSQSRAGAGTGS